MRDTLESYIKSILNEEGLKSPVHDWRRFIRGPVDKNLLTPPAASKDKTDSEEDIDELLKKFPKKGEGMSSQMVVSSIEPSKKLNPLISLSKDKAMRESFIREQVMSVLKAK